MGKCKVTVIVGVSILTKHLNKSGLATQTDITCRILYGRIPVEVRTNKSVMLRIVGKGLEFGVVNRKTVLGGNPQSTITIFNYAFYTVIYQSIGLGKHFKALFAFFVKYTFV